MTEEQIKIKLGLDARDFEKRLAESARIAKAYGDKAGSAMYTGPQQGSMPQSWASMANLAKQSQDAIRGAGSDKGLAGIIDQVKQAHPAIGGLMDRLGGLAGKLAGVTAVVAPVAIAFGTLRNSMREAWELAEQGETLGMSSKFILDVGKAARAAGNDADEAVSKLQRFTLAVGQAQDGSKEVMEAFNALGVSPWGKTMEESLMAVAAGFGKIDDAATKGNLAFKLFGKGSADMIQMLEQLSQKQEKAKRSMLEQRDLDTLAEGQRKLNRAFNAGKDSLSDYAKIWAATFLRATGFVKNAPEAKENRIQRPEDTPEGQAKAAEARAKREKETAEAKEKYLEAVYRERDTQSKMAYDMQKRADLEKQIKETTGETKEKYELLKELSEANLRIAQGRKQLDEDRNRKLEKQAELERQITNERANRDKAQDDLNNAWNDRSGWTTKELEGSAKMDLGRAKWAMENYLGRRLTGDEIREANKNLFKSRRMAEGAERADEAAKYFRLLLPNAMDNSGERGGIALRKLEYRGLKYKPLGGAPEGASLADSATAAGLNLRAANQSLTTPERDPLKAQVESLQKIDKNIADLLSKAAKDGILIRPTMGK